MSIIYFCRLLISVSFHSTIMIVTWKLHILYDVRYLHGKTGASVWKFARAINSNFGRCFNGTHRQWTYRRKRMRKICASVFYTYGTQLFLQTNRISSGSCSSVVEFLGKSWSVDNNGKIENTLKSALPYTTAIRWFLEQYASERRSLPPSLVSLEVWYQ